MSTEVRGVFDLALGPPCARACGVEGSPLACGVPYGDTHLAMMKFKTPSRSASLACALIHIAYGPRVIFHRPVYDLNTNFCLLSHITPLHDLDTPRPHTTLTPNTPREHCKSAGEYTKDTYEITDACHFFVSDLLEGVQVDVFSLSTAAPRGADNYEMTGGLPAGAVTPTRTKEAPKMNTKRRETLLTLLDALTELNRDRDLDVTGA